MPLKAKERKGADLIIQRTDGTQVRGELIAVKEKSLLLLERDSRIDTTVNIYNVDVIKVVKKRKRGLKILAFTGGAALLGYVMWEEEDKRGFLPVPSPAHNALYCGVTVLFFWLIAEIIKGKYKYRKMKIGTNANPARIEYYLNELSKIARIRNAL